MIIGAGLMGTSLALAIKRACPSTTVDAMEVSQSHRKQAAEHGCFSHIYETFSDIQDHYDVTFLAVPPGVASRMLPRLANVGHYIVDLCSIKSPICEAAELAQMQDKFVPSHPMAGKASGGPKDAEAALFVDRPWIFLESWSTPQSLIQFVVSLGARPTFVADAATHDEWMASVSHGIHLASLSAMLASHEQGGAEEDSRPSIAGPAFWDITRLAASPSEFWVDTLMTNKPNVQRYLLALKRQILAFEQVLEDGDVQELERLLRAAKDARSTWESRRHVNGDRDRH
ncbi:prephenate dehydrogenase [Alicyclobacillus dauci]|uniref:Prephenate dehydrogenase/arogenate dehydrogenase family protein n=1 Tax=Alicyclobacillus dauci TaxID=1475485 RepID=A0ABY6YX27_9BACL|nr:prephenate dehydrogenase/arogenate dehydrogenase family protein [Alicyclobacillus dauci]WAH35130.1 prephenate dehydrogenase/arogenate dehydrogenase family protein [Alicyclobacillus dauci]